MRPQYGQAQGTVAQHLLLAAVLANRHIFPILFGRYHALRIGQVNAVGFVLPHEFDETLHCIRIAIGAFHCASQSGLWSLNAAWLIAPDRLIGSKRIATACAAFAPLQILDDARVVRIGNIRISEHCVRWRGCRQRTERDQSVHIGAFHCSACREELFLDCRIVEIGTFSGLLFGWRVKAILLLVGHNQSVHNGSVAIIIRPYDAAIGRSNVQPFAELLFGEIDGVMGLFRWIGGVQVR